MAVSPNYSNSKCSEAVVGTGVQLFQPHLVSSGTVDTAAMSVKIGSKLKCSASLAKQILDAATEVGCEEVANGNRVVINGFVRIELVGQGSFAYADEPWDPVRHRVVAVVIPFDALKNAVADITPTNVLTPTTVSILGAQDATTMEQNVYTKGNNLLIQGKGLKLDTTKAVEGVWIRLASGTEIKMTVSASTSATIDCTCNDAALVAGEATLVVRSRDGKGDDYMPVEATKAITIKVAA